MTLALASLADAQQPYPGTTNTTEASRDQTIGTLGVGQTAMITSCGFPAGSVNLSVNGTGGASDTVDPDGCARSTVSVLGVSLVRVEGMEFRANCARNIVTATGGGHSVSSTFSIDCPATARAGGLLPRTGAAILASSLAGGVLLAGGSALLVSARRRRSSSAAA